MKTNHTISILSIALLLMAAPSGAHAESLLADGDFDSFTVGTAPDNDTPTGNWILHPDWLEATTSQFSVAPAPAGGTGHCLHASFGASETLSYEPDLDNFLTRAVTADDGETLNVSFDLYVAPGRGGAVTCLSKGPWGAERGPHLIWGADGKLYVRVDPGQDVSLFPFPRGVWQTVRLEVNVAKKRYNIFLSEKGQPVTQSKSNVLFRSTSIPYLDRFSIIRFKVDSNNANVDAYYDNIRVTTDPAISPVTADLAAGGATTLKAVNMPAGDATFQWQRNGKDLSGKTGATLELSGVTAKDAGDYTVVVTVNGASVTTDASKVRVFNQLTLITPPRSITAAAGSATGFSVAAIGAAPLTYQWRLNGADLPGKTDRFLTLGGVQITAEGAYSVVVTDATGASVTSDPATLAVLVKPAFVQAPLAQSVVAGGSVTFSAKITGNPAPFTYEWRKGSSFANSTIVSEVQSADQTAFLTLNNVQAADAGTYRLCLANAAVPEISSSSPSRSWALTVLPDTDGDGMPDEWETANGLNPADPADALLDRDANGINNLTEYRTGSATGLRVESVTPSDGHATVSFTAAANQTYTVLASSQAGGGAWEKVADVVAQAEAHLETVTDPKGAEGARFYRVVTPRRP